MAFNKQQVTILKKLINEYCRQDSASAQFEIIKHKHDREAIRILVEHAKPEDFRHPEYGEGLVQLEALINSI